MMNKWYLILGLSLLLYSGFSQAQVRCHANEYNQALQERDPEFKASLLNLEDAIKSKTSAMKIAGITGQYIKIPIVVHVIHNDASNTPGATGSTNISDQQILSQIQVLNEDFRKMAGTRGYNDNPIGADMEIEFCLAVQDPNGNPTSGIIRVYNSKSFWSQSEDTQLKSLSYWPSNQYLNIWVTNLVGDVLGYSQFPAGSSIMDLQNSSSAAETDGVVLDYKAFGTNGTATAPYHLGRTATHEIGHWFGLRHMWDLGQSSCGDDGVDDTPLDDTGNVDSDCVDSSFCNGIWIQDMPNNYMDYSTDVCFNLFTLGQKDRVWAVINSSPRRYALFSSAGCQSPLNSIDKLQEQIRIFPNPAGNVATVSSEIPFSGTCEILNATGELMREEAIRENQSVDLTGLQPGVYFFRIFIGDTILIRKLIRM